MSQPQESSGASRGALAFIFVTVALDMLALGIVVPVLPMLVLEFQGGDTAQAAATYGVFGSVFAAMQFLCAPLLGALSDRFGRRPAVLLSNLGLGLDYVLMALAPSLGWLLVGRIISGICAASFSIPMAYVADVTPPERRAASFGFLGAAFGLGFVVGPAFGGLLGAFDPRLPFWLAAGFSLANALYGLLILPESLPRQRRGAFSWRQANPVGALGLMFRYPQVLSIAAVIFLSHIAHESLPSVWVLYTGYRFRWDSATVGFSLAGIGICAALVQAGLVGSVVARYGERRGMLAGLLFGAIGFFIYGAAPTGFLFCLGIPFIALWGFAGPSAQSIMTRQVDPSQQGRLQGAIAAVQSVAHVIGPLLFTEAFAMAVKSQFDWELAGAPYILASAILIAAALMADRATRALVAPAPVADAAAQQT